MRVRFAVLIALLAVLAGWGLPLGGAKAQPYYPQPYPAPYPPGYDYRQAERERWHEEKERRHEEREFRREERARQAREEAWERHNRRYFGNEVVVQPYPGEPVQEYRHRVREQCDAQWNVCASTCTTIPNDRHRAACVANCNNDLYQCKARF